MTDDQSIEHLQTSRHVVGVLRLLVEPSGRFSGAIVNDDDTATYRFAGPDGLVAAVGQWLSDTAAASGSQE